MVSATAGLTVERKVSNSSEELHFSLVGKYQIPFKGREQIEASSTWQRGEKGWTPLSYSENSSWGGVDKTYAFPEQADLLDPISALFFPCFEKVTKESDDRVWTLKVFTGRHVYPLEIFSEGERATERAQERYFIGRQGGLPLFRSLRRDSVAVQLDEMGFLESLSLRLPAPFGEIKINRSSFKIEK